MKIFSGSASGELAKKVAKALKIKLSQLEIHVFPDEEKRVRVVGKVVDEDCVVVQSASTNADKNYMELFFIVDALKRSGAKSAAAVIPYLGYQRQDHVFRDGEVVSLGVIIKMLEGVGVDKVVTFDLHSIKIPELFHIPVVHLSALPLFAEKIKELTKGTVWQQSNLNSHPGAKPRQTRRSDRISKGDSIGSSSLQNDKKVNAVLVSPDMGGIRRIKIISEMLGNMPYVSIEKNRDLKSGKIEASKIHGDVGKVAFVVDDMISTGNTILAAADLLSKKGVEKIFVFATHPVFSKDAPLVLQKALVEKVYVTDTISIPKEKQFKKLEVLSVAEMIAKNLKTQMSKLKSIS